MLDYAHKTLPVLSLVLILGVSPALAQDESRVQPGESQALMVTARSRTGYVCTRRFYFAKKTPTAALAAPAT